MNLIFFYLLYIERRPSARITENTIRKLNRIKMLGKWLGTIDRIKREGINNLRNFSIYSVSQKKRPSRIFRILSQIEKELQARQLLARKTRFLSTKSFEFRSCVVNSQRSHVKNWYEIFVLKKFICKRLYILI